MFLDKGNILSNFNHLFDTEASCHISLYSHFGMGKTRLIQELSKSRKTLYFKATPLSFEENIRMLKALCTRQFHKDFQQAKKLTDVLKLLAKHAEQEPLLIIFDDFPHLAAGNRRISTLITSFFNRTSNAANLFLVLCKPASAYEKECTKEQHAFLLRPFRFFEMRMLYPEMSLEEQMLLYSVTGGVPAYLRFFNPEISVDLHELNALLLAPANGQTNRFALSLFTFCSFKGVIYSGDCFLVIFSVHYFW